MNNFVRDWALDNCSECNAVRKLNGPFEYKDAGEWRRSVYLCDDCKKKMRGKIRKVEIIEEKIEDFEEDIISGPLDEFILVIQEMKREYEQRGYFNLEIRLKYCNDYNKIELWGKRHETPSETKKRIDKMKKQRDKKAKANQEAKVRRHKEYLKLKKEFGQ